VDEKVNVTSKHGVWWFRKWNTVLRIEKNTQQT